MMSDQQPDVSTEGDLGLRHSSFAGRRTNSNGLHKSVYTRGVNVSTPTESRMSKLLKWRRSVVPLPDNLNVRSVSQQDAEATILKDAMDGAFFFRKSTAESGSIVLSMASGGNCHHFLMNFPMEITDPVVLNRYLRKFAKKHSKSNAFALPCKLSQYITTIVQADEDSSNARPMSTVVTSLDVGYEDIIDDDVDDVTASFGDAPKIDCDEIYPMATSDNPDGVESENIGVVNEPVYDEFDMSTRSPVAKQMYTAVRKNGSGNALNDGYSDPQDAILKGKDKRKIGHHPRQRRDANDVEYLDEYENDDTYATVQDAKPKSKSGKPPPPLLPKESPVKLVEAVKRERTKSMAPETNMATLFEQALDAVAHEINGDDGTEALGSLSIKEESLVVEDTGYEAIGDPDDDNGEKEEWAPATLRRPTGTSVMFRPLILSKENKCSDDSESNPPSPGLSRRSKQRGIKNYVRSKIAEPKMSIGESDT